MKDIVKTVIVLTIGGTIYTFSQADVVKNFSRDTGLSQQEAEQYVSGIKEEDMAPFDEIGAEFVNEGQSLVDSAAGIDCTSYEYEWESPTMSCYEGKSQIEKIGNSEIALGNAYKIIATKEASEDDISLVISNIDILNDDLSLDIVSAILDPPTVDDIKKRNSYNKALLQAALDSK